VGVGVGEGVGEEVAVGRGVGVCEAVALGSGAGGWVLDGIGVAGVAEGARATGEAGPGLQLLRLLIAKINARSRNAGRRMGDFPFENELEKATKDAAYHVVVLAVPGGDDLFLVPAMVGDPGRVARDGLGDSRVILGIELHTPHRTATKAVGLHAAELTGGQQDCLRRQAGDLVPMPQEPIEGLTQARQDGVGLTYLVDGDR
jgi:hypothetical protein